MTATHMQKLATSSGLFVITDPQQLSQYRQLVDRVQQTYGIEPTPKWGLDYKLYLSKPETSKTKNEPPSSQHVLHLSHMRSNVFIALEKPAASKTAVAQAEKSAKVEAADIKAASSQSDTSQTTVSTQSLSSSDKQESSNAVSQEEEAPLFVVKVPEAQKDATLALLNTKMALLWTLKTSLNVNGVAFRVFDSSIRIGEVRAGTSSNIRAVVVAIEITSVTDDNGHVAQMEQDRVRWEVGKIRDDVGLVTYAKEAWGFGKEESVVAAWCDIMKLR